MCQISGAQYAEFVTYLKDPYRWFVSFSEQDMEILEEFFKRLGEKLTIIIETVEESEHLDEKVPNTEIVEESELLDEGAPIIEIVNGREYLCKNVPIENVPDFYNEENCLWVNLGICPLSTYLHESVLKGIPEEIRSYFAPGQQGMSIYIGHHDLFGNVKDESVDYVATSFCSISFDSYGCPKDWNIYRAILFSLPEVHEVKQKLEAIVGPLEQCVIWSL